MINPCGSLHFGMTKCLKSTILILFNLSVLQSKLFIFQALLIHDITSSDHNAQLVALGIALRGGRRTTYQAHDQNNSTRERHLLLNNTSKEKLGHFLSLHQLFHQSFYSMLEVAASGSLVEVRLLHLPAPARSESEHVFPIHTRVCTVHEHRQMDSHGSTQTENTALKQTKWPCHPPLSRGWYRQTLSIAPVTGLRHSGPPTSWSSDPLFSSCLMQRQTYKLVSADPRPHILLSCQLGPLQ